MSQAPANRIRVLLIDDDEDDYLIIRKFVQKIKDTPFALDWTDDLETGAAAIRKAEHDIYMVDYRLGSEDGLELLSRFDLVQRSEPFIILTGAGDERVERKAMRMGVADYLVKGRLDSELLSRVLHYALQRKLIEAQRVEQLMEINRSKDEFIALASHQLRTPATAVKQYVGMILEGYAGTVTEEQQYFLQSAYDSNERQIQVVNDILRVAKLDLKKIVLSKHVSDIGKLLESIIHDLSSQFAARSQTVTYDPAQDELRANVDSEYIRMAISNIVDNASKYTPEGKHIEVSMYESDNTIHIAVRDEGVGIDAANLEKLFKKFSRIENPLSVKVGGSGLGLYWSREIVELHGGTIAVKSALGKGTTFIIGLPALSNKDAAAVPKQRQQAGRIAQL